jgi:hypothetical protein
MDQRVGGRPANPRSCPLRLDVDDQGRDRSAPNAAVEEEQPMRLPLMLLHQSTRRPASGAKCPFRVNWAVPLGRAFGSPLSSVAESR